MGFNHTNMSSQTVETRLHSLPKFLRSEPSPKIQDSAFPPFKIEHRYRGVYERAGFDVNLGSNEAKPPQQRRNPSPPYSSASSMGKQVQNNGTHYRQRLQQLMHSYQSRLQRLLPSENGYDGSSHVQTRPYGSSGDLPDGSSTHLPTKSVALVNLAPLMRLQQSQRSRQFAYQPQTQHTHHQDDQQHVQIARNSEPRQMEEPTHSIYEEPQGVYEQYDPRKQARAMRNNSTTRVAEYDRQPSSADSSTLYHPVPRIEETLELQNANSSVDSVLSTSAVVGNTGDLAVAPMPYPTAPYPHENDSGHSTYVFSEPNHTSLSTAYSTNLNYNSKYDSFDFSPQQEPTRNFNDLLLDLNQPVEMEPYQENGQLASLDAHDQDNERHRLSHELANFKRDVEDHKAYTPISPPLPNSARQGPPQLPTASPTELGLARFEPYKSPVPAIVTTMDDGTVLRNSTDYEHFLKSDGLPPRSTMRQSQFSTVSSIISKDGEAHYDDDHDSEDEVERELERQLRSLTVGDDTEAYPAPAAATEQKIVDDAVPTIASPNSEYPNDSDVDLNADSRRLSIKPLKTERIKSIQSEVKPLSPKVHQIDEELRGMNLGRDPIIPIPEDFENSEEVFPPGRGPCRSCKRNIEVNAAGKEKSVYSRTGELTGQWHRGCFKCSYSGCEVKFNKSVPCYAFNDRPYCNSHYHEVNDSLCTECGSGIEGECIENELQQKWHVSCLRCEHCSLTIRSDYYLINGTTYCETDALAIINGQSYSDTNGNLRGLSTTDRIEKRRTRMMYVEL